MPNGGINRVAFSEADLEGREFIQRLMRDADLVVRVDTAGGNPRPGDGEDRPNLSGPNVGGISQSSKEFSRPDDIVNGANVLLSTILKLDSELD
jgi:hypothetical protein